MTVWAGTVYLGAGWMIYRGPLAPTGLHTHHAVQAVWSSAPFALLDQHGGRADTSRAVIPADRGHRLQAAGQRGAIIYLDPSSGFPPATRDAASWASAGGALAEPTIEDLAGARRCAHVVATALGSKSWSSDDELVADAMAFARQLLPGTVRLETVAAGVGMSPSRLTHRFSAAAGIPLRRWLLWERLQVAGREIATGANLTVAAHTAGFADSSHLNRTFRRMFGVAPSDVAGIATWHVDI